MNLRDKRPTNYYKELCLELPVMIELFRLGEKRKKMK